MRFPIRFCCALIVLAAAASPAAYAQPSLRDLGKTFGVEVPPIDIPIGKPGKGNPLDIEKSAKALSLVTTMASLKADPSMSPSQSQIHNHVNQNYQMQGAIGGAALMAVVGCLVADYMIDAKCTDGAILGALAGGAIGYVVGGNVAERQKAYASKETTLNAKLAAAEQDLSDAKSMRIAAENLVKEHRATLAQLRQNRSNSDAAKSKMATEVGYMVKDADMLKTAKRGLEGQLASLKTAIANTPKAADASKLQAVYTQLQAEDRALDAALNSLSDVIDSAKIT